MLPASDAGSCHVGQTLSPNSGDVLLLTHPSHSPDDEARRGIGPTTRRRQIEVDVPRSCRRMISPASSRFGLRAPPSGAHAPPSPPSMAHEAQRRADRAQNRRMIELVRLRRSYTRADGQRVDAVDDVSLVVPEGEFVCLIGPSGCGKSTLLQMVAGLEAPSSGSIVVDGGRSTARPRSRDGLPARQRLPLDAGRGQCRIRPQVQRRRGRRAPRHRARLFARVGLPMSSAPGRASFRAACSSASPSPPSSPMADKCCLLDEPFGALDYVTRRQLQDVLLDLWNEPGRAVPTVVFVTHDVDEAITLADRIIVMRGGAIATTFRSSRGAAARHRQPAHAGHGRDQAQAAWPPRP